MAEEEEEAEETCCDLAALQAHGDDPPLPPWPYNEKDDRKELSPDEIWAPWATAKPPIVYDPPQFKYGCNTVCAMPTLYYHRPGPPCDCDLCSVCCIPCCNQCCLLPYGEKKIVQFSEPDEWFLQMLRSPSNGLCPDSLKGVWWMQDNPGSETCCTFHQADWKSDRLGFQDTRKNYCHDATNIGGFAGAAYQLTKYQTRMEVGPTGKWINIGGYSWMYVIQPGDQFTYSDGTPFVPTPGDIMRVSYLDPPMDPKQGFCSCCLSCCCTKEEGGHTLMFQYMVRRLAYLDPAGQLVKTPAYDELLERVKQGPQKTCCGNNCWGFWDPEEVPESDKQSVSILGFENEDEGLGDTNLPLMVAPVQDEMA